MSTKLEGVIEIECTPPKNRQLISVFTMSKLRGRYRPELLARKHTERPIGGLPMVPGMKLVLDLQQRTMLVLDPLGEEKHKSLFEEVDAIHKAEYGYGIAPMKPQVYKELNNDQIKTILNEWSNWAKLGKITVEQGSIPTPDEVSKLPGRLLINQFNSSPQAPKYAEPSIGQMGSAAQ